MPRPSASDTLLHPPSGRAVWRARLLCLAALLGLGFLAAEGALRFLLFHPSAPALRWGQGLRDASLFADPFVEDVYWRLRWVFDEQSRGRANSFDPLLGWTDDEIEPGTYDLRGRRAVDLRGRRPLLLYGASYAAGRDAPGGGFATRLEGSALGSGFGLVNYAIGGQGIDQMYLLVRETVPRHAPHDPLVVIAAVAGTDYERCNMTFRVWPKPLLTPRGEGLDLQPPSHSVQSFLDHSGVGVRSFFWRWLLHGSSWLPHGLRDWLAGGERHRAEQRERTEAIVLALRDELERQGVDYFFLVLHGPRTLRPEQSHRTLFTRDQPPPDGPLLALLEREGVPYVDTRPYLEADPGAAELARRPTGEGPELPSAEGYDALFAALADGVQRFGLRPAR